MFGIITSDKSCTSTLLDLPLTNPVPVEGGEKIRIFSGERIARFYQGSVIRLKPNDVAEMRFFITSEAKALQMSADMQYAKSKGIETRDLGQARLSATTEQ